MKNSIVFAYMHACVCVCFCLLWDCCIPFFPLISPILNNAHRLCDPIRFHGSVDKIKICIKNGDKQWWKKWNDRLARVWVHVRLRRQTSQQSNSQIKRDQIKIIIKKRERFHKLSVQYIVCTKATHQTCTHAGNFRIAIDATMISACFFLYSFQYFTRL